MFGDLQGMMGKLKDAQKKVEETKKRLNSVLMDENSADGKIKITLTANREIKAISIDNSLLADAEELEDYLVLTLNKAIEKASKINENEMIWERTEEGQNIKVILVRSACPRTEISICPRFVFCKTPNNSSGNAIELVTVLLNDFKT